MCECNLTAAAVSLLQEEEETSGSSFREPGTLDRLATELAWMHHVGLEDARISIRQALHSKGLDVPEGF